MQRFIHASFQLQLNQTPLKLRPVWVITSHILWCVYLLVSQSDTTLVKLISERKFLKRRCRVRRLPGELLCVVLYGRNHPFNTRFRYHAHIMSFAVCVIIRLYGLSKPYPPGLFHSLHDDVIKWKHFPRYWPSVRGIHRSPANSPHKGLWRRSLMFSLNCAWINGWANNREAGDLRRHRVHHNVTVMQGNGSHGITLKDMGKCLEALAHVSHSLPDARMY